MDALTTGACNVAMGQDALGAATIGCNNIAIGRLQWVQEFYNRGRSMWL